MPLPRHLLLLIAAALTLLACERNLTRAASDLPPCDRACVVHPQGAPVLELGPQTFTAWDPSAQPPTRIAQGDGLDAPLKAIEERSRALIKEGKPIPATGYLFCHRDTPGARLHTLASHPTTASWKAFALAGRKGSEVGFVVLALWRDAPNKKEGAPPAVNPARVPIQRGSDGAAPAEVAARVEACQGAAVCPLLEASPNEWTCGELVALADALQERGRLVGLRVEGSP